MEMITAEDFLKENANEITYEEDEMFAADVTPYMLIEFAQMHVKAALEAAAQNSTVDICDWEPLTDMARSAEMLPIYGVDESSIRNAYPLNLIK